MMATVDGVETNAASRFIDHTLATPWETFVADIEAALRNLSKSESSQRVDIYYYGLNYKLEKRRSTTSKKTEPRGKDSNRDFSWLLTTYNLNWFILFSRGAQSNDYHWSHRATVLSGFITAIKNFGATNGLPVPAFFTYSYVTDISKASDLIGYQLLINPHSKRAATTHSEDSGANVNQTRWCKYESNIYRNTENKPHLRYYDGLRPIFQNILSRLNLGGRNGDLFYVETGFNFKYLSDDVYGVLSTSSAQHPHKRKSTSCRLFSTEFINRLIKLTPGNDVTLTFLTDLTIDLTYKAQPHNAIIDNANFTTYVPSKLPPHCWNIGTSFYTLPYASAHGLINCTNPPGNGINPYNLGFLNCSAEATISSSWMSLCVRKLLSFYLLCVVCTQKNINIETISAEVEATESMLHKETLDRMLEVLSEESRSVFYALCKKQIDDRILLAQNATIMEGKCASLPPGSPIRGSRAAEYGDRTPPRITRNQNSASPNPLSQPPQSHTSNVTNPGVTSPLNSNNNNNNHTVAMNLFGEHDDDWSSRSDRHRGVLDILFSNESIYHASRGTVPANKRELSGDSGKRSISVSSQRDRPPSAPPGSVSGNSSNRYPSISTPKQLRESAFMVKSCSSIGLWFGLYSVLCATAAVDAHDMATIWSKSIRQAHISTEDGQMLPTFPAPWRTFGEQEQENNCASSEQSCPVNSWKCTHADMNIPICSRTLWSDALDRLQDSDIMDCDNTHLMWPDQSESLVIQKLQLLQFCITMQDESPIYLFPEGVVTLTLPKGDINEEKKEGDNKEMVSTIDEVNVDSVNTNSIASSIDDPDPEKTRVIVENSEDHPATTPLTASASLATMLPDVATLRTVTVKQPALFRRLPLTEDTIAMNKYLSRKVNSSFSRSNREHPTLKVQLQFPSVISDMKAFKHANPDLDLRVFCLWYGFTPVPSATLNGVTSLDTATSNLTQEDANQINNNLKVGVNNYDKEKNKDNSKDNHNDNNSNKDKVALNNNGIQMPIEELEKAWASCEGVSCEDQGKPLFQCEKESEKALAFLETVSAAQLSTQMLSSGMKFLFGVACNLLEPYLASTGVDKKNGNTTDLPIDDTYNSESTKKSENAKNSDNNNNSSLEILKAALRSDVAVLKEQIELAAEHLTLPKMYETSSTEAKVQVSVAACILVDSVAGLLQKLEQMVVTLQTLEPLLVSSKGYSADSLIHALARRDSCTAETDAEMSILYEVSKTLRNFKEQIHDWHSKDGRELGQPTSKIFSIKLDQPKAVRTQSTVTSTSTNRNTMQQGGDQSSEASARIEGSEGSVSTGAAKSSMHINGNNSRTDNTANSVYCSGTERAILVPQQLTAVSPLSEVFHMQAAFEVEADLLRLSYRVPE